MTDDDAEIIIDSREPWERMFEYLEGLDAPEYRLDPLDHKADYVLRNADELAIQRKEMNDFVSSLDTLKKDLYELRANYQYSALLLEGHWRVSNSGVLLLRRGSSWSETIPVQQFHNFVVAQQLRGTLCFYTVDLQETAQLLVNAHDYIDGEIQTAPNFGSPVAVLTMFPGVGAKVAGRLWDEYNTLGNALDNVEEWEHVRGIGEKTQEEVLDWLY